ncbi:PP2C family protein-serine/threonine phosphatase [Streptomyces sp. NPDC017993]|uniref:PP2C family protein-serine/threonine phosphatase n=1 Tax=Streptomyces sp. NPDC017993 TaxID=3365027 RepID=UPI00378BCF42
MTPGGREETSVSGGAAVPAGPGPSDAPGAAPAPLLDLLDQALVWCGASGVVSGFNRPAARLFPRLQVGEELGPATAGPMATAFAQGAARFDASFEGRRLVGRRENCEGHMVWLVSDLGAQGEGRTATGGNGRKSQGTPGDTSRKDADPLRECAAALRECQVTLKTEREHSAFLERAGAQLGGSLHHGRTVRTLARSVLPLPVDAAVAVLPVHGRRSSWHRAGPGDTEASGQLPAEVLERVPPIDDALSGLRPGAGTFPADELRDLTDVLPPHLTRGGQALVLQLSGSGVSAGALLLVRGPERPGFAGSDVELARRYAARAGLALATSALYSQQAQTTAVLRVNLEPRPLPVVRGVSLGAAYRPAAQELRISGDFYDVAPHPDGGVSFFFGDVCGKGAEAAVLAGLVQQSLRTLALTDTAPVRDLHLLNDVLLGDESRFTTLVTGTARPAPDHGLTVVTAGGGHLPPLILRHDGLVEEVTIDGTVVGILPDPSFDLATARLAPGELMLLYSDGVTEARGGPAGYELYGDERLARALAECRGMPAGAVAERVELLTAQWLSGRPHDDIAVLALQAPPRPHPPQDVP